MKKVVAYLKEVSQEMKMVSWPKKNELTETTKVVILGSVLFGIAIAVIDLVINQVIQRIIGM